MQSPSVGTATSKLMSQQNMIGCYLSDIEPARERIILLNKELESQQFNSKSANDKMDIIESHLVTVGDLKKLYENKIYPNTMEQIHTYGIELTSLEYEKLILLKGKLSGSKMGFDSNRYNEVINQINNLSRLRYDEVIAKLEEFDMTYEVKVDREIYFEYPVR